MALLRAPRARGTTILNQRRRTGCWRIVQTTAPAQMWLVSVPLQRLVICAYFKCWHYIYVYVLPPVDQAQSPGGKPVYPGAPGKITSVSTGNFCTSWPLCWWLCRQKHHIINVSMYSIKPHGCGFMKFELKAQMLQQWFTVNRGSRKEANTFLQWNCCFF